MSPDATPPSRPLDVFVHVPKTAGSTLNGMLLRHHAARHSPLLWSAAGRLPGGALDNPVLARWLSRGLARGCSSLAIHAAQEPVLDRILRRSDWVSGHLTRRAMEAHLERVGRPGRFYTIVRDPTEQIASHYQWWIEIHRRGPWRFYRYDRFFRGLSRRIRATDNADPQAVIAVLREHRSLFLNIQAGYVAGPGAARADRYAAALGRLAAFGVDDDVGRVFEAMTGAPAPTVPRVNRSRSTLDRGVFRSAVMQDFLRENHAGDVMLYEAALALQAGVTRPPSS